EVEVVDLVADLGRNTRPVIADREHHFAAAMLDLQGDLAALGHRLHAIQDDVQERLLEQVHVDTGHGRFGARVQEERAATPNRVRRGKIHDVARDRPQVRILEAQIHGTSEIDQKLYHAIEALDLAADDIHVPVGIGIDLFQLLAQHFQ